MSWSGTVMTKPISIGDISQAVHNSSLDVGTLIARGDIKKWALHKPVMLITGDDTPNDISDDATWDTYMKNKVRAVNDNSTRAPFGLLVTPSYNIYEISGDTPNAAVDWVYQQPPETGTFWRRMLDFNGYVSDPNIPMDPPDEFTYYKQNDVSNTLRIVVYDGEAGSRSIGISALFDNFTLGNYHLMVAFKPNDLWYYTIMSDPLSDVVSPGGADIQWTLPSSLSAPTGTYTGYIFGVNVTDQNTGVWDTLNDSFMQTQWQKIPLPFANKADCKFTFKVGASAPTNIVSILYTFYLSSSYKVKRIRFEASKYGSVTNNYTISLSNVIVRDDNDNPVGTISNDNFVLNNWTTSGGVSSAYVEKNVESYNINTGGTNYPNIDESSVVIQQNGSYTISPIQVSGQAIIE